MTADIAARSRAAFTERFPEIMSSIAAAEPQCTVIAEGGVPTDITVGEKRIYGGDARRLSAEQVRSFMQKPLRLIMEVPEAAGLVSPICIGLKQALERTIADAGMGEISREPQGAPTFLVIFGVGLGYHIDELIRATGARWVIIVEPFIEFFARSFDAIDWQQMLARVDSAGGDIHLITELDPGRILQKVMQCMSRHGTPHLDGTWVFTHYPLWTFDEARKRLHGAAEFAYVNRGFFEDEIKMMTNAVANYGTHSFWLLDTKPRLHRSETVAIVGAGPSLDEAVETLHRIRDRVVLFSSGTALRPLLRHGFTPDFHCELENGPQVAEIIEETGRYGDLSKITLIASATVDPGVPPMFGETFLFFRDSVSSTRILRGEIMPISGAAPTCVNTAMATAEALGFTDIVLFGADCGMRPGMPDHAEGTAYRDIVKWKEHLAKRVSYPLEVEGNFGGVAHTNWVYDASRRMLSEIIRVRRLIVTNCSDGVLIAGAVARVPEGIEVRGAPVDRPALIAALKRSMTHYRPGEILRTKNLAALQDRSAELYGDLRRILAECDHEAADFAGLYATMIKFLNEAGDKYAFVDAIPEGSLTAVPRLGMFYGSRVGDGALQRAVFETLLAEFTRAVDAMERATGRLLATLTERMAAAPAA
jgi:flagellin glycosyltransferase Maf-like protein/6-hydroxymethylpterin diphosphokinase MptE-like protein